jgi:hypothetical protein
VALSGLYDFSAVIFQWASSPSRQLTLLWMNNSFTQFFEFINHVYHIFHSSTWACRVFYVLTGI